mmetsp:Transcript_9794/g.20331  ORF Transcript_9794/g.20331 Transcript_9794/m.20331 type:complete len:218 (+) Transcript_9794:207-860(+)|eukprot:CAMPEP_0197270050 /NCGR_PEP_ID=MMETSP1432-20130617/6601_1 /TAXON_ID=44447 /ORGANISM="Pseudo-nitzschia delicatissima, Strain UNC1205" /LENGTH=217 /DNA_ID=CAMNT_0042735299 /DNA_START=187 /DNA_END=840 /DNA_ORIENTATION=+
MMLQVRLLLLAFFLVSAAVPLSAFSYSPFGSSWKTIDGDAPPSAQKIPEMDTPARQSMPDHLRLEAIPGKGLGVITNVQISAGTVVGDYKGEIMTEEEKDRRYLESFAHLRQPIDEEWRNSRVEKGQTITGTYLYGIDVPNQASQIFVDAEDEYHSLWTRFLNHASPPAANVNPKSLYQGMDGNPRVWFVSIRDIEVGEEICFDYGDDYWLPEDNVV